MISCIDFRHYPFKSLTPVYGHHTKIMFITEFCEIMHCDRSLKDFKVLNVRSGTVRVAVYHRRSMDNTRTKRTIVTSFRDPHCDIMSIQRHIETVARLFRVVRGADQSKFSNFYSEILPGETLTSLVLLICDSLTRGSVEIKWKWSDSFEFSLGHFRNLTGEWITEIGQLQW